MAAASDGSLFWRSSFCSRWRSNSIIKQAVRSRTTLSSPENANSKFWIIFISNPSRVRLRLLWISPLRELFGSGLRREKKRDRLVVVWRRWHLLNHSFLWRSARERGLVWHSGGVGEVERMQLFYKKKKSRFLTPWSGSPSLCYCTEKKTWGVGVGEGYEVKLCNWGRQKMLGNCGIITTCESHRFSLSGMWWITEGDIALFVSTWWLTTSPLLMFMSFLLHICTGGCLFVMV